MRTSTVLLTLTLISAPRGPSWAQSSDDFGGFPKTGQPAADVLASHDRWGNPTFIGGLTNSGPTSHSVW